METVLSYKLEGFEGPLDLLLALIAKNKLNIRDIKLSVLIDQYLAQIDSFRKQELEIKSEFLEMAARLIYMKTVSLLPRQDEIEKLTRELTGELIEYSICREMAAKLSQRTDGFDLFVREPGEYDFPQSYALVHTPDTLYTAYMEAVGRGRRRLPPSDTPFTKIVAKRIVSVSEKIVFVLRNLVRRGNSTVMGLYKSAKSRSELVATFLAVLELCKSNRIEITGETAETAEIKLIGGHRR